MSSTGQYPNLIPADTIRSAESTASHPWNPKSLLIGTHLSKLGGLTRTGVSLVRIPSGHDSFVYHSHHREEEWIYILSGRAVELTYLMGGENLDHEIADFPRLGKRMVRMKGETVIYDLADGRPMEPFDE